jgi:UDP-sugar pyrophosphorylase
LVAGGLGERLGYNGIKLELPAQTVTHACYLETYCQQILAIQSRYGSLSCPLPLAIMVCDYNLRLTFQLIYMSVYARLQYNDLVMRDD